MDACFHQTNRKMQTNTKPKMIFVMGKDELLYSSVEHLLSAHKDWRVIGVSNGEDLEASIKAEGETQLYIVAIHPGNLNIPVDYLVELFKSHPAVRVITIGLENNDLEVYCKQKIVSQRASDLITLIENDPSPYSCLGSPES